MLLWSNGATTEDLSLLLAGTYTVTVTNSFGCTSTITKIITSSGLFTLSYVITNPIFCHGGIGGPINLSVAPVAAGYTYIWSNGAITQDINNIPAGTYTVTVTNSVGCTSTLSVVMTEPPAISLVLSPSNVSCFGGATGSIDMTVSGGSPNYAYGWSNGGITEDINNLFPGNYQVTVFDFLDARVLQTQLFHNFHQ